MDREGDSPKEIKSLNLSSSKTIFSNHTHFFCNNCGYKSSILNWLCPKCNTWNEAIPKTNIDIIEENSFNAR